MANKINRQKKIESELVSSVGYSLYNGWGNRTKFGYHSYNIDEINIVGQRNPKKRLDQFKNHVNFEGKNVLDFGCNVGAMLHHLPEIKSGIGFDYDEKCIKVASNIANILGYENQKFLVHDCDKNSYDELKTKIDFKPDVIFLLSLGSWIKSWKNLYDLCLTYENVDILLEINNEREGSSQLQFFEDRRYKPNLIIDNSKDDSTNNNLRKTYLIKKP
jgi:SAM-dependent methyltransferase